MEKLISSKKAQSKLCCVVSICFLFMIIEVIGGYLSNSIAIMTDAAHMFSDVAGFGISIIAIRYGLKSPNATHSYGYHRSEVLGALTSIVIIWILVLGLIYAAITRVYTILYLGGYDIEPKLMVATAVFGLCCNIVNLFTLGDCSSKEEEDDSFGHDSPQSTAVTKETLSTDLPSENKGNSENLNVRAAMIHMVGDLL